MTPLLTVIVPVFNECGTIDEILTRVAAAEPFDKEVLIVDDGSVDGTSEHLEEWEGREGVAVYRHECNKGKGTAIRTALAHARGKYVVIQDADLEYDPNDYVGLLRPLIEGTADVAFGSRALGRRQYGTQDRRVLNPYRLGVAVLNVSVHLLYGRRITDEATCYKMFKTQDLRTMDLQCERFEFCPEATAKALRMGLRITELPIRYAPRGKQAGKKIGLRDAFEAFMTLWKWRRWRPAESTVTVDVIVKTSPPEVSPVEQDSQGRGSS